MILNALDLEKITPNTKLTAKLNIVENALGDWWHVPVMILKGAPGPCVGITAALHGNELNGISTIHALWEALDPAFVRGTVVLIPILNTPSYLNGTREFTDGKDLNRVMPGNENGTPSEVYSHLLLKKIIAKFNFLIDLHTASFGRINSLYVKASLSDPEIRRLAEQQNPEILVDMSSPVGSLRQAATELHIPAITVEIGNPNLFQAKYVQPSIDGLVNTLIELGMMDGEKIEPTIPPVLCSNLNWIYAKSAGILRVYPGLVSKVSKGDLIATIVDVFGELVEEIVAPHDGVIIGKSTDPVCDIGARILNLGSISQNCHFFLEQCQ